MFTTRLISGIILVLLSIVIVGQGGILLYAVTALISIIGLFELYRALGMQRRSLAVVGYVTACSYYGLLWFEGQRYVTLMIIACLMAMMALYVLTFPEYKTEEVTGAFFGVCYVPIMLSFLYQTRDMSDGAYLVWLIFLSSWGCDTFAYCTGMLLGRHKLAPVLSPKKSIEGLWEVWPAQPFWALSMHPFSEPAWRSLIIPRRPVPLPAPLRRLFPR